MKNRFTTPKQERIFFGAIKMFGINGYAKTSINDIVGEAQVSKGLVFHHFENKANLYLACFEHCLELTMNQMVVLDEMTSKDFFDILQTASITKVMLMKQYPFMFEFLASAYTEQHPDIAQGVQDLMKEATAQGVPSAFSDVDTSNFQSGITLEHAIKLVTWTSEGFAREVLLESHTTPQEVFDQFQPYVDVLKRAIYLPDKK